MTSEYAEKSLREVYSKLIDDGTPYNVVVLLGGDATAETILSQQLFSLPMVMIYTAYAYWVFRGKVKPGAGYTH